MALTMRLEKAVHTSSALRCGAILNVYDCNGVDIDYRLSWGETVGGSPPWFGRQKSGG